MGSKGCSLCCKIAIILSCALVVGVVASLFRVVLTTLIEQQVKLSSSSTVYSMWTEPQSAAEIRMQFWTFNLSNPDEVVQKNATPVVTQHGPYTFREERHKVSIKFNTTDSVSYREKRLFHFVREESVGELDEQFTTANLQALTMIHLVHDKVLPMIAAMLPNSSMGHDIGQLITSLLTNYLTQSLQQYNAYAFRRYAVKDIIFGVDDPMIDYFFKLLKKDAILGPLLDIASATGMIPDMQSMASQGALQNNTDDGAYLVNTGASDSSAFGQILQWQFSNTLNFWSTPSANMINGSDGTLYHPNLQHNDTVYLFSSDICRSLYAVYDQEFWLNDNDPEIKVYSFVVPDLVLLNHTANPDNVGFCTPDEKYCLGSGVMNVSSCKSGAPLIVSLPHFYLGDPRYVAAVQGLQPIKEQHESVLDIEPVTGTLVRAAKRLQFNAAMTRLSDLPSTNFLPLAGDAALLIMPVMWLNESSMLKMEQKEELHVLVYLLPFVVEVVSYCVLGVLGLLLLVVALVHRRRALQTVAHDQRAIINEDHLHAAPPSTTGLY